jgi:hypothetical protein
MTGKKSYKSALALGACVLAMLTVVPASFAGEDGGCDDDNCAQSSGGGGGGGSDTGSASGGVQTGFGGMSGTDSSFLLPLEIAGGGILVLSAAGAMARRRVLDR